MRIFHCLQRALVHRVVAPLAAALGGDLLVGQHGAQRGAPVDRRVVEVGQPVAVDDRAPLDVVQLRPGAPVGGGPVTRREVGDQLGDRAGPVGVGVVPGVEDLEEDPLRPPVVALVGGGDRPARVVAEPERPQLAAHVGDVGVGGGAGVGAGLAGVLLGGQAEGVVAERVEHVVPVHPLEAGVHVGADVAEGVTDVQPRSRRVREHVHHEQLGSVADLVPPDLEVADGVGGEERAVVLPVVLPAPLDLVGERRGVPVGRQVVGLGAVGVGHAAHVTGWLRPL